MQQQKISSFRNYQFLFSKKRTQIVVTFFYHQVRAVREDQYDLRAFGNVFDYEFLI